MNSIEEQLFELEKKYGEIQTKRPKKNYVAEESEESEEVLNNKPEKVDEEEHFDQTDDV